MQSVSISGMSNQGIRVVLVNVKDIHRLNTDTKYDEPCILAHIYQVFTVLFEYELLIGRFYVFFN